METSEAASADKVFDVEGDEATDADAVPHKCTTGLFLFRTSIQHQKPHHITALSLTHLASVTITTLPLLIRFPSVEENDK